MSAMFALAQTAFGFFEDGTETGATAIAATDTNISRDEGTNLQLRIRLQESGGVSGATTDDYQLQFSLNAGAYANVNTVSTGVVYFDSASLTNAGATTNRLGAGSGSFVAGQIAEDGLVDNHQITASNFTEHLFTLTLVAADLAPSDTIDFRVLRNGATFTYSVTPRITVTSAASPISGTSGITFAAAATGQAIGAMSGASAVSFAPTGAMAGAGALVGTSALTLSPTGTMAGAGVLAGAASFTLSAAAALLGLIAAAGASSLTFTPSGAMTATAAASGAATVTFTPTGAMTGQGALAGASSLVLSPAGALTGAGALAGASALSFAPAGVLAGAGALSGATTLVFAATGTTASPGGAIAGSSALTFTLNAGLAGTGALSGSSEIVFLPTATVVGMIVSRFTALHSSDDGIDRDPARSGGLRGRYISVGRDRQITRGTR